MTARTMTNRRRAVAFAAVAALVWPVLTSATAAQATDLGNLDSNRAPVVETSESERAADARTSVDSADDSAPDATGTDSPVAAGKEITTRGGSARAGEVTVAKWVTEPASPVIGSTVRWHLTVEIPVVGPGDDEITQFRLVDQLPANFEHYSTIVLTPYSLPVEDGFRYDAGTQTITFGTDLVTNGGEFQKWLNQRQGETLEFVVAGRIVAPGATQNTMSATINGITETSTAYFRSGLLQIEAIDSDGNGLENAGFEVFASEADALAGTNPIYFPGVGTTLVTDTNGAVSLPGLYVGTGAQTTRDYWVRETAAPENFTIDGGNVPGELGLWQISLDGATSDAQTLTVLHQREGQGPTPEPTTPQPPAPSVEQPQPPTSEVLAVPVPAADTPAAALAATGSDTRTLLLTGGAALLLLTLGAAFVATHRKTRNTTA